MTPELRPLHLSVSDSGFGGANLAAFRLHQSLTAHGHELGITSRMRVLQKCSSDSAVEGGLPRSLPSVWPDSIRPRLIRLVKKRFRPAESSFYSIGWPRTGLGAEISAAYRKGHVSLLHFHALDNAMLSVEEIGRLPAPIVWTLHDQWAFSGCDHYSTDGERFVDGYVPASRPAMSSRPDLNRWVWQRKARSWIRPIHLVAPSRWMADCARRSALAGDWPISVIPNPIDLSLWAPVDRRLARSLLNLPQDAPLVLFGATGGIRDRRKGGDLLLAALHHLCHGGAILNDLQLAVFGQEEAAASLMTSLPIHSLGRISDPLHLRLLYAAADVFVIPSRQDNLPNTGLEAHACGIPVVAFRTCGLVDIVEDRVSGALADPFDPLSLAAALHWVLEDPQRRHRLGTAARQRAETLWSSHRIASLYSALYRQVLATSDGRP